MASISREPNGRRTIQFVGPDGKRRSIRLGKVSQRTAEAVKVKVEALNTAALTGHAPDDEVARWAAGLDQAMSDKLAAVGLLARRQYVSMTLGDWLDCYVSGREADAKPNTLRNLRNTRKHFLDYFGPAKLLRDISAGDADEWRLNLKAGRSEATVSREVKRARQFFRAAVRKRLIPENPFTDLPAPAQVNKSREHFISRETAGRVLEACPDAQWRLLFALSRFGGLRCPSEHLALRWADVDWERDRFTVHSPKTEHHAGGASRVVPIFAELRPYLEEAWDQAEPGTEYVITRYRKPNVNLRTQLLRIIKRAAAAPWPRLFHNLRASRQTELSEHYPSHVVCDWLGNSENIARQHYLQVLPEHFARAAKANGGYPRAEGGAESGAEAVQNPVQQSAAYFGSQPQETTKALGNQGLLLAVALGCDASQKALTPPGGVEPPLSD